MLVVVALDDAYFLGVLSSYIHVMWSLAAGGRLGVGNDPRYNKTRCFETFPFPDATDVQKAAIRELAEQLDAHRKRQQALHPRLTLTDMYNVLEKLRAGEPLTAKEKSPTNRAWSASSSSFTTTWTRPSSPPTAGRPPSDRRRNPATPGRPQRGTGRRGSQRPHPLAAPGIPGPGRSQGDPNQLPAR
jgi:hypothetical protein